LKDSSVQEIKAPSIYINSLQADNLHFLNPEHQINLLYNQNNLNISLSGISYESLGNMKYSYRLTPYQNEWIETSEPETRFSHLPPGNYIFEAYTTNAKNVKSTIVQLRIFIKPAFWQTLFFKTSIILVAIALLFIIIRWQLRKTEKRRYLTIQQKKHFAELELEAIKAQINPHFIYNCLNSIQYLNYKADYEQAQEYLSIFSRLIRMTMQYSQKVFITIDEEVDYLSNYLQMEQLRFKDKLNYTIKVDERLNKSTSLPAMLLQPYVENALKHGITGLDGGGVIHISFRKVEENIEIIIRDNGPGFPSLQTDGTLGLRLSATRALSYNELFNIHVKIECFNEQDADINKTGAIVKITITPTKNGQDKYKSGYHR
jgi:sensor histidine kinase YesM